MRKGFLISGSVAITLFAAFFSYTTMQPDAFSSKELYTEKAVQVKTDTSYQQAFSEQAPIVATAPVAANGAANGAANEASPQNQNVAEMAPVDLQVDLPVDLPAELNAQAPAAGTEQVPVTTPAPVEASKPDDSEAIQNAAANVLQKQAEETDPAAAKLAETVNKFTKPPAEKSDETASTGINYIQAGEDIAIGSPDAPLTVYDYSSLTCPHCGNFHNTILPKVKQYYIDTGKVRWVFRTFPHNNPALRAEMLVRCLPKDQHIKMTDMLFSNQERWAFSADPLSNLAMIVKIAGVDEAKFQKCTTDKALESIILKIAQDGAEKYEVSSTPTFIFNDGAKKIPGGGTYESFAYEVDNFLENLKESADAAVKSTPIPAGKL
jgi:protein-disulfide isomerase